MALYVAPLFFRDALLFLGALFIPPGLSAAAELVADHFVHPFLLFGILRLVYRVFLLLPHLLVPSHGTLRSWTCRWAVPPRGTL